MTRRRTGAAPLLLLLVVVAGAAGLAALTGVATAGPRAPAAGPTDDRGTEVYLRDCAWCHGQDGEGTQSGPSLEGTGELAADFYLRTGRMPLQQPDDEVEPGRPAYDDRTIGALVDHIGQFGDGPAVPVLEPGDPVAGRRVFLANCAACHSSSGTGMVLSGGQWAPELDRTDPQQVAEAVRLGPGAMPPFGEQQLDQQEVDDVVAYVAQLGPAQVRGGAGLDQFGPIVEGLVAWLVLVPVLLVVVRLLGKKAAR